MKIYDGFLFFKELDLLEIRLNIMDEFVDYFVITESTETFSGKPKPLYFLQNAERFDKWRHKILYNAVLETPNSDVWDRERFQRNAISRMLVSCDNDDLIITGDLDEIPNMNRFATFLDDEDLVSPLMTMYYYYLNLEKERNWQGTRICKYGYLKDKTIDQLRNTPPNLSIYDCGWHFSFLGGVDMIKDKLGAYGHQEFNNDYIKNNIQKNIDENKDIFFRPNTEFKVVPIDRTFPIYIQDNQEKLSRFIKK